MRSIRSIQGSWSGKNHTSIPKVNPGRFKVAIKGTPTFPVRGIIQGVPSMGISWLVFKEVLAIVSNKETKSEVDKKPKLQSRHLKAH